MQFREPKLFVLGSYFGKMTFFSESLTQKMDFPLISLLKNQNKTTFLVLLLSVLHLFHFFNPLCTRRTMTALFFCRFELNKYLNLRKRRLLMKKTGRNFPQSLILKKKWYSYYVFHLIPTFTHIARSFHSFGERKNNFFSDPNILTDHITVLSVSNCELKHRKNCNLMGS